MLGKHTCHLNPWPFKKKTMNNLSLRLVQARRM